MTATVTFAKEMKKLTKGISNLGTAGSLSLDTSFEI
jgi:hypothetical protein